MNLGEITSIIESSFWIQFSTGMTLVVISAIILPKYISPKYQNLIGIILIIVAGIGFYYLPFSNIRDVLILAIVVIGFGLIGFSKRKGNINS